VVAVIEYLFYRNGFHAEEDDGPTLFASSGSIRTHIALVAARYSNTVLKVMDEFPSCKSPFVLKKVNVH
jgi:hypothetical protein